MSPTGVAHSMYWWKIDDLRAELARGTLSERARFQYLLVFVVLSTAVTAVVELPFVPGTQSLGFADRGLRGRLCAVRDDMALPLEWRQSRARVPGALPGIGVGLQAEVRGCLVASRASLLTSSAVRRAWSTDEQLEPFDAAFWAVWSRGPARRSGLAVSSQSSLTRVRRNKSLNLESAEPRNPYPSTARAVCSTNATSSLSFRPRAIGTSRVTPRSS